MKLDEILDVYCSVYNKTLEYIKKRKFPANNYTLRDVLVTKKTKKHSLMITLYKDAIKTEKSNERIAFLQKCISELETTKDDPNRKFVNNEMIMDFETKVSKDIRTCAVNSVCSSYEGGFTKIKKGQIK